MAVFHRVKWTGCKFDHSLLSSGVVKNEWNSTSSLPYDLMAACY